MRNPDNWPVEYGVIEKVYPEGSGGYSITMEDSWSFMVRAEEVERVGQPPVVDETVEVLGGLGFQIRGIFIGGREYRYQTREEADAERVAWLAEYEAKKEADYQANINKWIERASKLDRPFRERITRFAKKDGKDFWRESGAYELFCVEQANALYRLAIAQESPVAWLDNFYKASWEEQKQLFPSLDEGHSGNTFGGMVALAKAVAEGRDI